MFVLNDPGSLAVFAFLTGIEPLGKVNMSLTESSLADRKDQNQPSEDVFDNGFLRVEHRNYYVACGGQSIKLPRTEFLIFSRLARSPERIVPAEELWEHAWGTDKPLNTESLHVYIYRLRSKLVPHNLRIETMVNVGYRLILDSSQQS